MTITFALLIPCLVAFAEPEPPATPEPEVTVEFLRDVLRSQLESVRSLSATYTMSQKSFKPPAEHWAPSNYELHLQGDRVSIHIDQNDPKVAPRRYIFDGRSTFHVIEHKDRLAKIEVLSGRTTNTEVVERPLDPIGGRVPLAQLPLPTMMADPSCTLKGLVDLDGVSCWAVSLAGLDRRAGAPILVHVWFDPSRDYLPRRITIHRHGVPREQFEWTWAVVRFEEVPGASGLRWFPVVSEFRQPLSVQTLEVTHFAVNPRLPDNVFVPDASDGAQVLDVRNVAQPKQYVAGTNAAVDHRVEELAEMANTSRTPPPTRSESGLSAVPVQPQLWMQILLWGSLACVLLGAFLWWRSAH